ncbi:MAG TPA: hypothetical protein PLT08_16410 [Anaerolineales bacterium]|nr:hypothetical protein [Anaerolineales bacterium]
MSETIIINLTKTVVAEMTKSYLELQYPEYSFKVVTYYSELKHVVTHQPIEGEQLQQMQAYAQGVSDVLSKLLA